MLNNTVADALTRIRNASASDKKYVHINNSKYIKSILQVLLKQGYVKDVEDQGRYLLITLKYFGKRTPVIEVIQTASKPSCRVYRSYKDIPKFYGGFGITVVSTSEGIKTDAECRASRLGGEIICYVA